MKKIAVTYLCIALAFGASMPANADWGHREYYGHRDHYDGRYRHGGAWVAPAAILALTGLAIGATYAQASPPPVYVQPAYSPPPPPRSNYWYYCNSAGQYYPYVRYCPEGWQPVMPTRFCVAMSIRIT